MKVSAVLFDIDGTLFTGLHPIPGAAETVGYLLSREIPCCFISNGTRRARAGVLDKLSLLGLPIHKEQIITPAIAAIEYLKIQGISECCLISGGDVAEDFLQAGICLSDNAHTVIIGDAGDNFTYASMNRVFRLVIGGADLIALEKDRYWMDSDGLSLGAGAFVTALEYASGRSSLLIGKPSDEFFTMALTTMGADPSSTMMVGDDVVSDIGGAQRQGMAGVLVMTGKYKKEVCDHSLIKPDYVIPSVAAIPDLIRGHFDV
jgi:HAD superfamily hydrolase (TIGR01458 family)